MKALSGLRAFLAVVQEPGYRRIVIQEGPAVLGYERYREQEERSTFANVLDIVRSVLEAGKWQLDEPMLQTYARIFFGAMSSAGESVATAADPEEAADRVEAAIAFLLSGVQMMVENGVELPTDARGRPRRPAPTTDCRRGSLTEGDRSTLGVDRDQLDPDPAGGHLQLAALGLELQRGAEVVLAPRAFDDRAAVEEERVAPAFEDRLRHRVAGGVEVAGVTDVDPQHQHAVGRELVTVGSERVLVDVGAVLEGPVGRVRPEVSRQGVGRLACGEVLLRTPRQVVVRACVLVVLRRLGDLPHVGEEVVRRAPGALAVEARGCPR